MTRFDVKLLNGHVSPAKDVVRWDSMTRHLEVKIFQDAAINQIDEVKNFESFSEFEGRNRILNFGDVEFVSSYQGVILEFGLRTSPTDWSEYSTNSHSYKPGCVYVTADYDANHRHSEAARTSLYFDYQNKTLKIEFKLSSHSASSFQISEHVRMCVNSDRQLSNLEVDMSEQDLFGIA